MNSSDRVTHHAGLRRTTRRALVSALVLTAFSYPVVNGAGSSGPKQALSKLDRVLKKAAENNDLSEQRVIVRTRAGRLSAVADRRQQAEEPV